MRRVSFIGSRQLLALALPAIFCASAASAAVVVPVPNGDFETIPPDPNLDGDNDPTTGDVSPPWNGDNNVFESTNEGFTRPSTFQLGWQSNGPADTDDGNPTDDGKFGLQQPRSGTGTNQLFYQRSEPAGTFPTGSLLAPFNGNFIGFINMDDADGFDQEAQSGVIGNLEAGTYALRVAVGARANQNWNDIKYDVMLVANPDAGTTGTSGGTVLGVPATATLEVLGSAPDTTNIQDLVYTLTLPVGDPLLNVPYAIRIAAHNTLMQNGIPDEGAATGNARFTQANFDNVRLEFEAIPEPSSLALLALGGLLLRRRARRA